jgi:predicted RNase H-like HicB family nuclease
MRYAIVIEMAWAKYSAFVSDLPGCFATGGTVEEAEAQIREAIAFHIDGLRDDDLPVPTPRRVDLSRSRRNCAWPIGACSTFLLFV